MTGHTPAGHRDALNQPPVSEALAQALDSQRLRIVASLIATTGDWDLAEDAVADAAERALRLWPIDGVPDNPAAWLTVTSRRRAIDLIRRADTERTKQAPTGLHLLPPGIAHGGAGGVDPESGGWSVDRSYRARIPDHRGDDEPTPAAG